MKNTVVNYRRCALLVGLLLLMALLIFPVRPAFAAQAVYKDDTYRGTGHGISGLVVVDVTVADGQIATITEVSQRETPAFWARALEMFERIIGAQSTAVDAVTGATLSSESIREAVEDALDQAKLSDDALAAAAFERQVAALPAPEALTLEDVQAVQDARAAYDALTAGQKAHVSADSLKALEAAEDAIATLRTQATDQAAADAITKQIMALEVADKLTLKDKAAVEAAKSAYGKLTDRQKALVDAETLKLLTDAEAKIAELEAAVNPEQPGTENKPAATQNTLSTSNLPQNSKNVADQQVSGNAKTGVATSDTAVAVACGLMAFAAAVAFGYGRKKREN